MEGIDMEVIQESDYEQIRRLISQTQLEHRVFPFDVWRKKPISILVIPRNHLDNEAYSLLLSINCDETRALISEYIRQMDDNEKYLTIENILESSRTILNIQGIWHSFININRLENIKKNIVESAYITVEEPEKLNSLYNIVYFLETASMTRIYAHNRLEPYSLLHPELYIHVAQMTMECYLEQFGEDYISFVFEYFYMKFSQDYKFLGDKLDDYKVQLATSLAKTIGSHSSCSLASI
jgi:hypothetical protein